MVADLPQQVRGSQTPRFLSLPPGRDAAVDDFADRAVRLARFAGLNLDPWQELVLRSMLRTAPGSDQWAAYESLILVPRQNGKSLTLEAFDLAKLFLSPPGHLIMHTAHLFPTAIESFRHLTAAIKNTPELWDEVDKVNNSHGNEGIELRNGSRLRFAARGVNGAGRGFSPDDVVFDEAYRLPPEAEEALLYAISAKRNPQLVYASSTGFPDSEILWALVERGRKGTDASLMMAEWSADPTLDIAVEEQFWQGVMQANPAFGYRLDERKTAAEYRKAKSQGRLEGIARERLGLWAETSSDQIIPAEAWEACRDETSEIISPPLFGLDVSPARSWAAIAAAGTNQAGRTHVEVTSRDGIVDHRPGTEWVVPRLVQLRESLPDLKVWIAAGSGAEAMRTEIETAGVPVEVVGGRDVAAGCGMFFDHTVTARLAHRDVGNVLTESLDGAKKRVEDGETAWVWGRKRSAADITPLYAATLALWAAVEGSNMSMHPINNVW